jgi:hypothetical protein
MPRFDKTGPDGKGPKTGRGLGKCVVTKTNGLSNSSNIRQGVGRKQRLGKNRSF